MLNRFAAGMVTSLALGLCAMASAQQAPRSGLYGSLTLAVKDDALAGVFSEERSGAGGQPQFSCIFLLKGRASGGTAQVDTWSPGGDEHIAGTLVFTKDGATLKLAEDHGGCGMTTGSMASAPYEMYRENDPATDWAGAAIVTAKRAVFRPQPGPAAKQTPYIVQYDPVVVLERRDGWVHARYFGEKSNITGWLPAGDLEVVAP